VTIDQTETISVLEFINRVRAVLRYPALLALPVVGTDDVLESALGLGVGGAENMHWELERRWVMRFDLAWLAERVATALALEWVAEPPEVALPDALIDLAVSEHLEVVVEDDEGWVRGWWVPDTAGLPRFLTPDDRIVEIGGARPETRG
jgi:hypothetical protein